MSEPATPNPIEQHHFLLRRLHSLTGLVPIGVFLVAHLVTNSTLVWGAANTRAKDYAETATGRAVATFQEEVSFINGLPALLLIELSLWGAIAFHSILGIYYATSSKSNVKRYDFQDNWRYTLQRISGYLGVFFIFYHVATLRWGWSFLVPGGTQWSHHWSASTLAAAIQGSWEGITPAGIAVSLFYFIGVSMLVFHFANGLWTMAITWGLTVSKKAQQRWGVVCAGLGAGLMILGWASIYGAMTLDPQEAYWVERNVHGEKADHYDPPAFMVDGGTHEGDHGEDHGDDHGGPAEPASEEQAAAQ